MGYYDFWATATLMGSSSAQKCKIDPLELEHILGFELFSP
jgi:hypothetical protein